MSLLELLTAEKVSEFNDTRGERLKVDLFAADLAGLDLKTVDLSGADVEKADLTESDLTQAGLYKARMNGIDGTSMKLVDCLGARIGLREAFLDQADLSGSDFANGDLSEAVLTNTKGTGLRLSAAKLKGVDAKGARWVDVDLTGAFLSKADFSGADLTNADLSEAAGGELIANGILLNGATATAARFPGAQFQNASFVKAKLQQINLSEADLSGADFTGADLTGANLNNAILKKVKLKGAILAEASLEGVDFSGIDLTDVDLTGHDPELLGLSDKQQAGLTAVGIPLNPDARLKPKSPVAASDGELIVALWENDDGADIATLRYAARTKKGIETGILPVVPASVLARTMITTEAGVVIVLLRERPGGIVVEQYVVGTNGKIASSEQASLGYPPSITPIVQAEGKGIRMWGIARRGPTLVISAQTPEGFQPVSSKPLTTARGFLGRQDPFLACKGNVLMPCTRTGVGNPVKSPEGYPGKLATAATNGTDWFVAWVEIPLGRDPGAIAASWLVRRGVPEVVRVTKHGAVLSLDCCAHDGQIWITWVEMHGVGDTRAFVAVIPENLDDGLKPRPLPVEDVDHATLALGRTGPPKIVLTTDEEKLSFVSLEGKLLGTLDAE